MSEGFDEGDECCSKASVVTLIENAHKLLSRLEAFESAKGHNCGIHKFRRKVIAEEEFLQSMVSSPEEPLKNHVAGSNLTNLQAVLDVAEAEPNFVYIDRKFSFQKDGTKRTVVIDIVSDHGTKWIKVTARSVS
jgi:hypothetical protein